MSLLPLFLSPSSQLNPKCRQFSASQGLKLYAKPPVPPPPQPECGTAALRPSRPRTRRGGRRGEGEREEGRSGSLFPTFASALFCPEFTPLAIPTHPSLGSPDLEEV